MYKLIQKSAYCIGSYENLAYNLILEFIDGNRPDVFIEIMHRSTSIESINTRA